MNLNADGTPKASKEGIGDRGQGKKKRQSRRAGKAKARGIGKEKGIGKRG